MAMIPARRRSGFIEGAFQCYLVHTVGMSNADAVQYASEAVGTSA